MTLFDFKHINKELKINIVFHESFVESGIKLLALIAPV
jgi:hypothetical protein